MKSRPSIERAAPGLLAVLVLHGAFWLAAGQANGSRPARGASAASLTPPAPVAVLQVTLLGEPLRQAADVTEAGRLASLALPPPPQAPMQPLPQITLGSPDAPAGPEAVSPGAVAVRPDRPALPVTSPDLSSLAALPTSGAAIRLRLHIGADGVVHAVDLLDCVPDDQAFADRLADVLRATPHIPARKGGIDVASIKDIEIAFAGGT